MALLDVSRTNVPKSTAKLCTTGEITLPNVAKINATNISPILFQILSVTKTLDVKKFLDVTATGVKLKSTILAVAFVSAMILHRDR